MVPGEYVSEWAPSLTPVALNISAAGAATWGSAGSVAFDTIPTGAIDGIVVHRTFSLDREAEDLPGSSRITRGRSRGRAPEA
jgi:hypothetical protein